MGNNICFADFEFTCGFYNERVKSELLSVGLVICDSDYNILERYYNTMRPCRNYKLTKQCRKLTHLTQEEISASPDSNEVMWNVVQLLDEFSIDKLLVWGNFDKPGIMGDICQHARKNLPSSYLKKVHAMITDIQSDCTKEMQLPQAVNIEELASVFGYEPKSGTFHNALNDAEALYMICKSVKTTDITQNNAFNELRRERIEKLAAAKKAAEEKRIATAFSMPLSDEEKEFLAKAEASGNEKAKRYFIGIRSRICGPMLKNEDCDDFVLTVYEKPWRIRICREDAFTGSKEYFASEVHRFSRSELSSLVMKIVHTKY